MKEVTKIIFQSFHKTITDDIFGKEERVDQSMVHLELNSNKLRNKVNIPNLTQLETSLKQLKKN